MFLCDSCHDKDCPTEFLEDMTRSRGRCEGCGNGASCYDCHGYKLSPRDATATRRDMARLKDGYGVKGMHPAKVIVDEINDMPEICNRCLGEVPCGCYSHEARLGLPYPSDPAIILDAYAEQYAKDSRKLLQIRLLLNNPEVIQMSTIEVLHHLREALE